MSQTIPNALGWWARMRGDQIALAIGDESMTFADYKAWSDRVAAMLIAKGLKPGDRVAICSPNSLTYAALIMGTIRAGGIVSPINFRYTAREIADLCEDTEPALTFAAPDQFKSISDAGLLPLALSGLDALREGPPAFVDHDPVPDAPVVIIATSGSTAKPKGVVFTNRSMTAYAANWAIEETKAGAGTRVICLAPLNTSAGFVQLVHYAIQGCTLFLEPNFVPLRALRLIEQQRIGIFAAVPAFFEFIAALPEFADADLSSLKLATAGGSRVSRQLLETYRAKGIILRQIYGQTEVGGNATIMPQHLAMDAPHQCGWGGVFIDLRVVRPDGTDCDANEPGEIIMRSPGMMTEYWRNPEETAKVLQEGWLYSGDIGSLDENGLLTFIDRLKDLIISGGLNISAAEVERIVCEFPGVVEALAIAAPDPKFGETPLVVYHGPSEIDVAALIQYCNDNLSNYKVPRYVAFSPEPLPRLATGKLSKPAVREMYADAHERLPRVR
ncbi:class I adenylate-forming enzyme family protein [Novosphingobium sp.]|uniref:class I adenylate-forming enzyme family protein n=1 Tax=Novosphingobium sp. TaxID=1874826 RepID=UPI0038BB39FD